MKPASKPSAVTLAARALRASAKGVANVRGDSAYYRQLAALRRNPGRKPANKKP